MNDELVKALHETANWIVALATESRFAHDELNALHHEDTVRKAADAIETLIKERDTYKELWRDEVRT